MPLPPPPEVSRRCLLPWLGSLLGCAAAATSGAWPVVALAASEPANALCGNGPPLAYPAADKPALVQSWLLDGRHDGPPPDCAGLRTKEFELLVGLTASFAAPGDLADMLTRFGAVSSLKGLPYYSFTDRKRQPFIRESYAIDNPASVRPRADYTATELRSGAELYFVHSDNRSSTLVPFGLQLLQSTDNGFQVRIENLANIRMYGLMLVATREMQWSVALERLGPGRWGYRSLLGLHKLRLGRAEQHRLSNLSRCVAMFDLLAGRQTDIEIYR